MTETSLPYYNDPFEEPYTGRVYTHIFAAASADTIEAGVALADVGLFSAQTVIIDATALPAGATFRLLMLDSGVAYTVRGGGQAILPALVGNVRISVSGTLSAAGTVRVHWLTTRLGTATWDCSSVGTTLVWTQSVVVLAAATSAALIAANPARVALRWMNVGANPFTVVPGAGPAVAGAGMSYNGASGVGLQGGSDTFDADVSQQAFAAISTAGTTVVVWEGV